MTKCALDVGGRVKSENTEEKGAITIELAMIINLTKVSPTGCNSHF